MRRLLTAVAAVALVAGGAQVQAQGNGKGNDKGGGGKPAAAAMQGGGQGKAAREQAGPSMAQAARGNDGPGNGRGQGSAKPGKGGERSQGNARVADDRVERASRGRGNDERIVRDDRGRGNDVRIVSDDRGRSRSSDDRLVIVDDRGRNANRNFTTVSTRGLIDGCPPGLAKKQNGCQPPGQVRNGSAWGGYVQPDWWGLRNLDDGRYFYRDGYLMRLEGDRIGGYVPLLGGALGLGNVWPSYYEPVLLPQYYEDYYALGPYDSYRYADDVIYRVDPETSAITSIAALLTGNDFAVGQPMPLGYDVYNVPYAYRDEYMDGPDSMYRYSDGYVYQVDPTTQLIEAVIELLV